MQIPPSAHFTPLSLADHFNADRQRLDGGLRPLVEGWNDWSATRAFGAQAYRGMPFELGQRDRANVILLAGEANDVRIDVAPMPATYLVFLHAVEDRPAIDPLPLDHL